MGNIKVLDRLTADMIAAGEVVERPASVVKELFENAKDAGATRVIIEIKEGGRTLIKITDNGCGMDEEDASLSVVRYATSKLKEKDDLFSIKTLGFRGEALASICAVSKVTITTRKENALSGTKVIAEGGEIINCEETGCPQGTEIKVENLFYNTPARYKFLKKDTTEGAYIEETVSKLVLSNPSVSIRFIKDGKECIYSSGDGDAKSAIYAVYGMNIAENIIELNGERNGIKVTGYTGNPNIAKPTRKFENFSVNGRVCKNRMFISGLENAYFQKMAEGKYPFCSINIELDYSLCDVNVHPQKAEVRFSNESDIYDAVYLTVKRALDETLFVKTAEPVTKSYEYKSGEVKEYSQDSFAFKTPEPQFPAFNNVSELNFDKLILREDRPVIFEFKNEAVEEFVPPITKEEEIKPEAVKFKVIGQIFSSYIVLEKDDEMILLDQHAAHERINYEKIYEEYKNRSFHSQIMMSPKILEMSAADYRVTLDNKELFSEIGIILDDFSDNSVVIREIPSEVKERQIERLVYEILEEIKNRGKIIDFNLRILFLVACKMSLKANQELTALEMEALAEKAFSLNGKTTCPHGRPLFVSFSKTYIENKFERS